MSTWHSASYSANGKDKISKKPAVTRSYSFRRPPTNSKKKLAQDIIIQVSPHWKRLAKSVKRQSEKKQVTVLIKKQIPT